MISISKLAFYSAPQLSYPITKLPHYILHAVLKLSCSPDYQHLSLLNRSCVFCIGLCVILVRVFPMCFNCIIKSSCYLFTVIV